MGDTEESAKVERCFAVTASVPQFQDTKLPSKTVTRFRPLSLEW